MLRTHDQRPTPWSRRRASSRAFSLLEVVMVLAIAGVLAAIAAPRIASSTGRQRALAAARRVAADLEMARASAMAASASRRVVFAPARGAYGATGLAGTLDGGSGTYVVDLGQAPYSAGMPAASFGDSPALKWAACTTGSRWTAAGARASRG